jgi:hypothetical protein
MENAPTNHMNVLSLWTTESELRARVENAPANAEARRDLAWCLVLLAMYQAGIEDRDSDGAGLVDDETDEDVESDTRSSSELFREHLWHMQVLRMLPNRKDVLRSDVVDVTKMLGLSPVSAEIKTKYDTAFRRLVADLQSSDTDMAVDLS